jgi:outer membrane receptor protein involved in Fe transport
MSFKRTQVCKAALAAIGGAVVLTSVPAMAQDPQRVEVTGSRIKRVDVEGTLPVTTINREELQASGAATVAEFMRTIPFASTGNFRPQSGSSAQSFAEIDLRGLGSNRTLVLIDGRRAAKGPMVGDAVDLNIIPMAMIERVEVLTDGASAIYGSDAIGGVVNFITRKDFQGIELMASAARPRVNGGDRDEASVIMGIQGERGRMLGGASYSAREIIFARERPWPIVPGASVYGNNYTTNDPVTGDKFNFTAIPDGCNDPAFYPLGASCRYDFKTVSADEAATKNSAVFVNGEYEITADWTGYMAASVSRVESFGRYAPTPGYIPISIDSPNNPLRGVEPVNLWHRFAAAGTRDNSTDNNYYNLTAGLRGVIAGVDVDAGFRRSDSQFYELGRNYIVRPIAQQYFNAGTYDVKNPSANDPDILNAIKATITRDARFLDQEFYASGTFGAFDLSGGKAMANVGRRVPQGDLLRPLRLAAGSGRHRRLGRQHIGWRPQRLVAVRRTGDAVHQYPRGQPLGTLRELFGLRQRLRAEGRPALEADAQPGAARFGGPGLPRTEPADPHPEGDLLGRVGGGSALLCGVESGRGRLPGQHLHPGQQPAGLGEVDPVQLRRCLGCHAGGQHQGRLLERQDQGPDHADHGASPGGPGQRHRPARHSPGAECRPQRGRGDHPHQLRLCQRRHGADRRHRYQRRRCLPVGQLRPLPFGTALVARVQLRGRRLRLRRLHRPARRPRHVGQLVEQRAVRAAWNINYLGRNEFQPNSNDARSVGSYTTHDVQFTWQTPLKGSALTVGVINLFDKLPQLVTYDGREFNFNLYDAYGRTAYVRYTQQF